MQVLIFSSGSLLSVSRFDWYSPFPVVVWLFGELIEITKHDEELFS